MSSPYLTGHHAPNRFEADAPDLVVRGEPPADLAGVFHRNGAEPLYPPVDEPYHWFDGDGMVYAFFLENGKVSMRNRWVRTEKLKRELAAGRSLFGVFGNPATTDPSAAGTRSNTANTNIVLRGGRLLALMEGAPPVELDPAASTRSARSTSAASPPPRSRRTRRSTTPPARWSTSAT
ncbi:MAG: hypothetical protein BGP03_13725 [Pseudonocardia sp. 73-21]|nr:MULTISPECIES: carotenoid oxygenase family protein [unclassified Pseudonocardia]OJY54360.1 MAG: hypothetical protein BGP03_13725 [Pseudonocardia sp. 73-21]